MPKGAIISTVAPQSLGQIRMKIFPVNQRYQANQTRPTSGIKTESKRELRIPNYPLSFCSMDPISQASMGKKKPLPPPKQKKIQAGGRPSLLSEEEKKENVTKNRENVQAKRQQEAESGPHDAWVSNSESVASC